VSIARSKRRLFAARIVRSRFVSRAAISCTKHHQSKRTIAFNYEANIAANCELKWREQVLVLFFIFDFFVFVFDLQLSDECRCFQKYANVFDHKKKLIID
jgi:hypothetical protein